MSRLANHIEEYATKVEIFPLSRDRANFAVMVLRLVADELCRAGRMGERDCSCAVAVRNLADELEHRCAQFDKLDV